VGPNLHDAVNTMRAVNEFQATEFLRIPRTEATQEDLDTFKTFEAFVLGRGVRSTLPPSPIMVASWLSSLPHEEVEKACTAIATVCDAMSLANSGNFEASRGPTGCWAQTCPE
jgi:hypothetical protein